MTSLQQIWYKLEFGKGENAIDVSSDLSTFVTSISITDSADGEEADSIDIELCDPDGRFMDASETGWALPKGSPLTVEAGYVGGAALPPLSAEIDELNFDYDADSGYTVSLRAKAAGQQDRELNTKRTEDYEETTLTEIAQTIADRQGLELIGDIKDLPPFRRVTQDDETDLELLNRLAKQYGMVVKIEGDEKLVFFDSKQLDAAPPAFTLDRTELKRASIRSASDEKYEGADVTYTDPATGETIEAHAEAKSIEPEGTLGKNRLIIHERAETPEHAQAIADEKLRKANRDELTIDIDLAFDPRVQAGINIEITGFGKFSGVYQFSSVTHKLANSGATTRASSEAPSENESNESEDSDDDAASEE